MKKVLGFALGVLTAIGGFVDIGDLVTNAQVGARFGLSLGWVVVLGVVGICVFSEMSGRVAAVSGRAVFDLVRERLSDLGDKHVQERRRRLHHLGLGGLPSAVEDPEIPAKIMLTTTLT